MKRRTIAIAALASSLQLAACKSDEPAAPATPAPEAPAPAAAHDHAAAEPAAAAELPAVPAGAKVFFVEPADGAKLVGPLENGKVTVPVKMGAEGIAIEPAGPVKAGSGHHHILVDVEGGIASGMVVPKDDRHLHFGQAQTSATLALAPGEHTLTLQLADGIHRSYGPALASTIKVTVAATGTVTATAP